ncbi:MAG TPA: WecB/TagA/CpsF family glycosyltransferase [Bacteroidota bacterium]|nr:WecB/TagA/CpsF family glycosyltransferase [Bacteroidota bacterium]
MKVTDGTHAEASPASLPPDRADILGIPIAYIDRRSLVALVCSCVRNRKKGWICGINAHAINLAWTMPWLTDFYRRSLANCSEGFGVTLATSILGLRVPQRIVWAYWVHDLFAESERNNLAFFFLGGRDGVASRAAQRISAQYPGLRIAGSFHGYFGPAESASVVQTINASKPDVLFVAMGMPKQEEWILRNIENLDVRVVFPVGALLDYLSGTRKRCPDWMVMAGLEWLYRLWKEPRRMWRRYLVGNPQFIGRIVRARWQMALRRTVDEGR